MASHRFNNTLTFNVSYEDKEITFKLSKRNTVVDLKREIFKKTRIQISQQVVDCWYLYPEDDFARLEDCCLAHPETNYLTVSKSEGDETQGGIDNGRFRTESSEESSYDSARSSPSSPTFSSSATFSSSGFGENLNENIFRGRSDDEELIPNAAGSSESESSSAMSFLQYFQRNFDSRNSASLNIYKSLEEAIREACICSYEQICGYLTNDRVKELFADRFVFLGWDVEQERYQRALTQALEASQLAKYREIVELKQCCILMLVAIRNLVTPITFIREGMSQNDFIKTLENAKNCLQNQRATEENVAEISRARSREQDVRPWNFQQLMLEYLGDRDYDSFEFNEHAELKKKIAFAFFGPPNNLNEPYNEKQRRKIDDIFQAILKQNNKIAKWKDRVVLSCIYNCMEPLPQEKLQLAAKYPEYNPNTDVRPAPLFVLRKCKNCSNPCRIFVDDAGRVYETWLEYITKNKHPECTMYLPKGGRYMADSKGRVILEEHLSPSCGFDAKLLRGADIVSSVIGIATGGVFLTSTAIVVAPALLELQALVSDCMLFVEDMNFFNSEARAAYFNILAGVLGFTGAGAGIYVSNMAASGYNISRGATATVNLINVANIGVSGINVANSGYDVFMQWWRDEQTPSMLTILQLGSSILFFGHAVYNFRSASTIVDESQANYLRDYQESLRSNRHRKMFNKLQKETIRQHDGSVQGGRAEVISALRNINNKDEVFATLTRANRAMNRNGIRFAASNGEIQLNGVKVDMTSFSKLDRGQVITFLSGLPGRPNSQIRNITIQLESTFREVGIMTATEITQLSIGMAATFINSNEDIRVKLTNAVVDLIQALRGFNGTDYISLLETYFPNHNRYFELFKMVADFFQREVDEMENRYQQWSRAQNNPRYFEPAFSTFALEYGPRAVQIFNCISNVYFTATSLNEIGLRKIIDNFFTWLTKVMMDHQVRLERRETRASHTRRPAPRRRCPKCGGLCYQPEQ